MHWKKNRVSSWKLYCIIDDNLLRRRDPARIAQDLYKAGVDVIQLRYKNIPSFELVRIAKKIKYLAKKYNRSLLIDDRVDVAMASAADGIHIGAGDIPTKLVKSLLGRRSCVGKTVHSTAEAKMTRLESIDYVSAGPIFKTPLKKGLRERGVGLLRKVKKCVRVPVLAIGGISKHNLCHVLKSGVRGVCVTRAVLGSGRAYVNAKKLINKFEACKKEMQTDLIKRVAKTEGVSAVELRGRIARGTAVVLKNKKRSIEKPCAVGQGLRTKINTNIGTSEDFSSIAFELRKLRVAEDLGSDTVMDLSTSDDLKKVRSKILEKSNAPLGTVPVYEAAVLGKKKYGSISEIPGSFFIKVIEEQAKEGVDFFTIHAGVTQQTVNSLKSSNRIMGMVSRGGAILFEWMLENSKENPLYEAFDEIIDIAKAFDITLSLGDGMRPGAIIDATDATQIDELMVLGKLQKRALQKGVQVIIEGPGHVPLNQIKANVELEKSICHGAPFYVLGPLVTDIAPGYDHITSAIGGAIAASFGADFLCYVTPAEHLRLPTIEDVKEGVVATKIAAHAADIAKKIPGSLDKDVAISKARFSRDWKHQFAMALDPTKCKVYRKSSFPKAKDVCTMCSEYCAIKISDRCLKAKKKRS